MLMHPPPPKIDIIPNAKAIIPNDKAIIPNAYYLLLIVSYGKDIIPNAKASPLDHLSHVGTISPQSMLI